MEVIILADSDMATKNEHGSQQGSEQVSGGPIQGLGQVPKASDIDPGPSEGAALDPLRDLGGEEADSAPRRRGGASGDGQRRPIGSLYEHHLELAESGYRPPKPKPEGPGYYSGRRSRGRALTTQDVRWIRENPEKLGFPEMAVRLGVSYNTVYLAAKGITWKRLNFRFPPKY